MDYELSNADKMGAVYYTDADSDNKAELFIVFKNGIPVTATSFRVYACQVARAFSDDWSVAEVRCIRDGEYLTPYKGGGMLWFVCFDEDFRENDLWLLRAEVEECMFDKEYYDDTEYRAYDDGSVEEYDAGLCTTVLANTIEEAKDKAFERFQKYSREHREDA